MYREFLTGSPSPPYALDGWLWHQIGDLPRAQSRLHQALQRDPDDVRALNELGAIFEELNYPDRALLLYEHSLDVDAKQPDVVERVNRLKGQGVQRPKPSI